MKPFFITVSFYVAEDIHPRLLMVVVGIIIEQLTLLSQKTQQMYILRIQREQARVWLGCY